MQITGQPNIDYKQLYDQQVAVIEQMTRQLAEHIDKEAAMSAEIVKLRKLIFGVKVERFVPAAGVTPAELQLALDLSAETVAQCKISSTTTVEYVRTKIEVIPAKPKAHPARMKLPAHPVSYTHLTLPTSDLV